PGIFRVLFKQRRCGFGSRAPNILHEDGALLPQNALNAANGVAFAVKQMADNAPQIDVVGPIITATAATLHRPYLRETAFPKTEHVLRHVDFVGIFADRPARIWRFLDNRHRRAHCASARVVPELMRCLRIAEGLNPMTRRGEIGTSLPVLGLRPMRWPFLRTTNEPNDDSFTVSPRSRQSVISLSTSSTSVADSVRDSPTFW